MAKEGEIRSAVEGRVEPPDAADERTMLQAFLDFQRTTVVAKVTGRTDADGRRNLVNRQQARSQPLDDQLDRRIRVSRRCVLPLHHIGGYELRLQPSLGDE